MKYEITLLIKEWRIKIEKTDFFAKQVALPGETPCAKAFPLLYETLREGRRLESIHYSTRHQLSFYFIFHPLHFRLLIFDNLNEKICNLKSQ